MQFDKLELSLDLEYLCFKKLLFLIIYVIKLTYYWSKVNTKLGSYCLS